MNRTWLTTDKVGMAEEKFLKVRLGGGIDREILVVARPCRRGTRGARIPEERNRREAAYDGLRSHGPQDLRCVSDRPRITVAQ